MKKNAEGKYIADDPRFPAHIYSLRIMRKCSGGHEWGCVSKKDPEAQAMTDKFLLYMSTHCPFCKKDEENVFATIK